MSEPGKECPSCAGTGKCTSCGGTGQQRSWTVATEGGLKACDSCNGTGTCQSCVGEGVVQP